MSRLDDIFASLRAGNRRALMPFVCGGHPIDTGASLLALERGGAAIAEVGIPFSDPIADGPVIAAAMHRALEHGVTPWRVIEQVAAVRSRLNIGVVAMCSVSIVHRLAADTPTPKPDPSRLFARLAAAGFDGLIVPDATLEESEPLRAAAASAGLSFSLLVAPNTPPPRAAAIALASSGFVYLLAQVGITGERSETPTVAPAIATLRAASRIPIACGFGISTPEQVRAVVHSPGGGADAAIVGSALVRRMQDAADSGRDPAAEAERFTRGLRAGLET